MKSIIAIVLTITIGFANGLYDYPYSVNVNKSYKETKDQKHLMYGDFEKILRFEPIFFDPSDNKIKQDSQDYLDEIIEAYGKYKDKNATLTVIGYTDHVQTETEKTNQSKWFPTYTNDLSDDSSMQASKKYAEYTFDQLTKKGIDKGKIAVEYRADADKIYTRAINEGRELNYMVMVAMYVEKEKDSDQDGVTDPHDKCAFTPLGYEVNEDGCHEMLHLIVHYELDSSVIREVSFEKLTRMIKFMKVYTDYKVELTGHTSSEGTVRHNEGLSKRRALSIKKHIIEQGVEESRISTYGRASTQPMATNKTKEGRELNRRVEVKLY